MSDNKKVIALAIHSLQAGGMENVMAKLANYFSRNHEVIVHLVLFGRTTEVFYDINTNIIIHKPTSRFISIPRFIGTLSRVYYLRNKILKINPGTVLSFGIPWNSFVLLALIGTSYPVYISDRGSPERKYSKVNEFLRRLLYRSSDGIIAQTATAAEMTLRKFPYSNLKVVGNPVEFVNDKHTERENIILSIGRLIATKHHDRLIKLFSRLNAPGWKLVIAGGNALKESNDIRLRQLIEDNNLSDKVILTGEIKNVKELYLKSKIFAFTSSVEGFPNVIAEALSAGMPVVAYNCVAGPSEMIVDGKNGFLVPVFEDDLFLERLQLLINDNDILTKMSTEAPESVKKFSLEIIGDEYYSFITKDM